MHVPYRPRSLKLTTTFLYTPAGTEGMFGEIEQAAQPGVPPPTSAEDVAKLAVVAAKYHFRLLPPAADQGAAP